MITELDVNARGHNSFIYPYGVEKLCNRLPNIEQLRCTCDGPNDLLLVVNALAKLSKMKVFSFRTRFSHRMNKWLEDHASELKSYSFEIKCETYRSVNGYNYHYHDVRVYEFGPGKQSQVLFDE